MGNDTARKQYLIFIKVARLNNIDNILLLTIVE